MNDRRRIAALLSAAGAAGLFGACGPQRVQMPQVPGADLVVLVSDSDGTTGRVIISNPSGTVELDGARESTRVSANQAPKGVTVMSESEVRRLFGNTLSALPPAAQHFTLHFRFESDELTEESRAVVGDILQAVKKRPVPEVAVIGHTDSTGTPTANFELGLKRAAMIRNLLVATGLNTSLIEVTSHGEGDLLVQTADEVLEPRNRRVEITIR